MHSKMIPDNESHLTRRHHKSKMHQRSKLRTEGEHVRRVPLQNKVGYFERMSSKDKYMMVLFIVALCFSVVLGVTMGLVVTSVLLEYQEKRGGRGIEKENTPVAGESTVDGGWSDWSYWDACVCGLSTRTRSCTNPTPSGTGAFCSGPSTDTGGCISTKRNCPHSCADIYIPHTVPPSGSYTIFNRENDAFEVYCLFYRGYCYTYVSTKASVNVNINDIYSNNNYVTIRHQRTDGSQYEVKIEQISRYKSIPLSVQFNAYKGYTDFQNKYMAPYLYLGLLPVDGVANHKGDIQGYKANGEDQTFTNCDGNPNSYFVFLFNQNKRYPTNYNSANDFMHRWVRLSTRAIHSIPDRYFSFMEMHMGGCGGYTTTSLIPNVSGAALGFRHDLHDDTIDETNPMCSFCDDIPHDDRDSVTWCSKNDGYTAEDEWSSWTEH